MDEEEKKALMGQDANDVPDVAEPEAHEEDGGDL